MSFTSAAKRDPTPRGDLVPAGQACKRQSDLRLRRKCACGRHTVASGECAACKREREAGPALRRRGHAAGETRRNVAAPPAVHDVLHSPGQALPGGAREAMEAHFGGPLGGVRLHTDARAAASAAAVGADAYAVGSHVVFAGGKFDPSSGAGMRLLAHELAHVRQSGATGPAVPDGPIAIAAGHDAAESEAEAAADAYGRGGGPAPATGPVGPASLHRQPDGAAEPGREDLNLGQHLAETGSDLAARVAGGETVGGFELGKSDLLPAHKVALGRLASRIMTLLDRFPGSVVRVVGHTDAVGPEERNDTLGAARAGAAADYLESAGVPADVLRAGSAGERAPLVKGRGAEPRNRRVEVTFEPTGGLRPGGFRLGGDLRAPSAGPAAPEAPRDGKKFELGLPKHYGEVPSEEEVAEEKIERELRNPTPPAKRPAAPSPLEFLQQKVRDGVRPLVNKLPKWSRDKVLDGIDAAVKAATMAPVNAALDNTLLSAEEKRAIKSAVEAAITSKPGGARPEGGR